MVKLVSFGYKYKDIIPKASAYPYIHVIDVRQKLRNPYGEPSLKKRTGLDPKVQEWIFRCEKSNKFKKSVFNYIPIFLEQDPTFFIGCHGGKHRSVALVERLARELRESVSTLEVIIEHRDLLK